MASKAEVAGEPNAEEVQYVKVGSGDVEEATEEYERDKTEKLGRGLQRESFQARTKGTREDANAS